MKYLFFLTIVGFTTAFAGCNNSNAGAVATGSAGSSSGVEKAVFSYSLSGKAISGGEVDATQTNNVGWLTESDKVKKIQFFLGDNYQEKSELYAHSLRFAIPGNTGTVTMGADDDKWNVQLFVGSANEKYDIYGNETFTVTVNNISASRVSGTFSGKMKKVTGEGSGKDEFDITDGKFDIPVRKDGK